MGSNMVSIRADGKWLLKELGLFIEPLEVCDAQGKLLGIFVPANMERCKEKQAEILSKIDWAEIRRRAKDPRQGEPLHKTLGHIKKLEQEMERRKSTGLPALTNEEAMTYYRELRDAENASSGMPQPDI